LGSASNINSSWSLGGVVTSWDGGAAATPDIKATDRTIAARQLLDVHDRTATGIIAVTAPGFRRSYRAIRIITLPLPPKKARYISSPRKTPTIRPSSHGTVDRHMLASATKR
jgi:hypothetical protein